MAILGAILAIGFLVLVHEAGHYFVARWCKMRVERFSIGFGPSIYNWPRKEQEIEEAASGRDEIVAALFRLARKRPRGRVGVDFSAKNKLDFTAPQLIALSMRDLNQLVDVALSKSGGSSDVVVRAWDQIDFTLAPIPFGGFVQIDGMALVEDVDPDDERAYPNRPVWQRVATIFAGPATNYLTAIVLGVGLYMGAGVSTGVVEYSVEGIAEGYDAEGKLMQGDRIVKINGDRIVQDLGGLPGMIQQHKDKPIAVTLFRDGVEKQVEIMAKPGEVGWWAVEAKKYAEENGLDWNSNYLIGITMTAHVQRADAGIGTAVVKALEYPVVQSEMILTGLWKIVTREEKGEVGGPVMITAMIKSSIDYGWEQLVTLLMLLNVYLGLFNLLPLPALDGGRLAFLGYEIITRRRPNPSIEQTVHAVGIMAFLVIMVLVTYKDIMRLFS